MQSADGLKLVWQKGDSATTSDTGFGSHTLGCLLADGVGICARVVPSVCTCSALLGSGSMAIQELGMCPYLSPQITRSGRSYGSTVSNVCFTSGTLSLPKLLGSVAPAVRCKSRLAGGGLADSGKRTSCDDHGNCEGHFLARPVLRIVVCSCSAR